MKNLLIALILSAAIYASTDRYCKSLDFAETQATQKFQEAILYQPSPFTGPIQ